MKGPSQLAYHAAHQSAVPELSAVSACSPLVFKNVNIQTSLILHKSLCAYDQVHRMPPARLGWQITPSPELYYL